MLTPRRRLHTSCLLSLLLVLGSQVADAQSDAQLRDYFWFPGAIELLEKNRQADFPDDLLSRKWLVGFNLGLTKRCKFEPTSLDELLSAMKAQSYILSAVPQATEGDEDADTVVKLAGCQNAEVKNIFRVGYSVMARHGGDNPEPEDKKKFLGLASPKMLKKMGLTQADVDRMRQTPAWWRPLLGTWSGPLDSPDVKGTIELRLTEDQGRKNSLLQVTTDVKGVLTGFGWAFIRSGDQEVVFQKCPKESEDAFPVECRSTEDEFSIRGRLSSDGKRIEGVLTVDHWRPKTRPVVLTKGGGN